MPYLKGDDVEVLDRDLNRWVPGVVQETVVRHSGRQDLYVQTEVLSFGLRTVYMVSHMDVDNLVRLADD